MVCEESAKQSLNEELPWFTRAQYAVTGTVVSLLDEETSDRTGAALGAIGSVRFTAPKLPGKVIAGEGEISVEHYYRSGDHGPAHAHVKGGGPDTRIGPNGKPLAGDSELTAAQSEAVGANKAAIRRAVKKIGRWLQHNERTAQEQKTQAQKKE